MKKELTVETKSKGLSIYEIKSWLRRVEKALKDQSSGRTEVEFGYKKIIISKGKEYYSLEDS